MTFFYDMNKKLKEVLEAPKSVNQQLNERAESKPVDEGLGSALAKGFDKFDDTMATLGAKAKGLRANITKKPEHRQAAYDAHKGIMKKEYDKMRDEYPNSRMPLSGPGPSKRFDDAEHSAAMHKIGLDNNMEEGMFDSLKSGMKKVAKKGLETLGHGDDQAMRKDLQKKMGVPQTGKKPMGEEYGPMESEGGVPMTPKQKSFAKLAPPADKITFADKIAGAKKEVDEMLGDVAAEAMRGALKGGQKKLDRNHNGKLDAQDFAMLRAGKGRKETDEGSDWSQLGKEYSRPKIGSVERGAKHDIEHTATGRRVTRRTDDQGISVGADDDTPAAGEKRGRGRPKGTGKAMGAKGPSGTSKLMKRESEQELDEKAVSKKQQKFMGMVHAAQKGEKAASPEVAKVAKTMKKKDAEDFASTKHKGLPEKVKSKKKEKTEESDAAPTSGKGLQFGKGIYDSLNREIENLIAESMGYGMLEDGMLGAMNKEALAKEIYDLGYNIHQNDRYGQDTSQEEAKLKQLKAQFAQQFPGEDAFKLGSAINDREYAARQKQRDAEFNQQQQATQQAATRTTNTMQKARSALGGMYEGLNESMSINASDSTEGGKSLTITATDEDALKLAGILRNAGLGGAGTPEEHGEVEVMGVDSPISGDEGHDHGEPCETCGSADCGCGDIEEALDENQPDWPTDEVESDDALQYSGGLNGPKSTGQTTVPVIANQGDRTGVDDEALRRLREMAGIVGEQEQVMAPESIEEAKEEELDEAKEMCEVCEATPCKCDESVEESIAKLRGLAGIQEAAKPDFTDVDDDGNKKESWKKAEQDKKDAEDKKVDESIFRMTNLWKAYKG